MSIYRDKETKVKYAELKYCTCQYAERKKTKENMLNWGTADVNIDGQGKQSKIYRTKILQLSIFSDEERKAKQRELKYCWCEYGEMDNNQDWNTLDVNMQRKGKKSEA